MEQLRFQLIFIQLLFVGVFSLSHLILYTETDHQGFSQYINVVACEDIPPWIRRRVISINTLGTCASGCVGKECSGECIEFSPGTAGHEDLSIVNMKRKLKSVKPCGIVTNKTTQDPRKVTIVNECPNDIWIVTIRQGFEEVNTKIETGENYVHFFPSSEKVYVTFWAKTGCDNSGNNCSTGQSREPCGNAVCQPPVDTRVEFAFPSLMSENENIIYDVSLVDGYTFPVTVVPSQFSENCIRIDCHLSLEDCPESELYLGSLRTNTSLKACLSPCKKWNYPAPFGMGKPENLGLGILLCCPDPLSPETCTKGIAESKYVELVQRSCPLAVSHQYDRSNFMHNCPSDTSFTVTFCG